MRRTSCPSVEISNRSDSGGDRQPTAKRLKRQNAPVCKVQTGAKDLSAVFRCIDSSYSWAKYPDGG